MKPITFQIQIEPHGSVTELGLETLEQRMKEFVTTIQGFGYVRYDMYVGEQVYVAAKK